jgi:nucleotide-binding universal stress UspA family protein
MQMAGGGVRALRLMLSGFPGAASFNDGRRAIEGPSQPSGNPLQRPGWLREQPGADACICAARPRRGARADPKRKDGQMTRWGLSRSGRHMIMNVTKILVPIDYSGHSDRALQWGASLGEKYGARLLLLHVIPQASEGLSESRAERADPLSPFALDSPAVYRAPSALEEVMSVDLVEMAQNDLKDLAIATLNERVSASPTVGVGEPAKEIVRLARDEAVDLIVMGTHGRSGLRHALLGSVAETVIRTAPCPVFTVKAAASQVQG